MNLKRLFLIAVLTCLSVAACLGIWAFVTGSEPHIELILTMLAVGFCSLSSLGCAIPLERGKWRVLMIAGLVCALAGLTLNLLMIWDGLDSSWPLGEVLGVLVVWAVAIPHMGLLGLTRFAGPAAFLRHAVLALIVVLAAILTVGFFTSPLTISWRVVGVLSILIALGTIGLPILQFTIGLKPPPRLETTASEIELVCPRCAEQQTVKAGKSACRRCRLVFTVEIEEPRCPQCGYLLYRLASPQCPECGTAVNADLAPPLAGDRTATGTPPPLPAIRPTPDAPSTLPAP